MTPKARSGPFLAFHRVLFPCRNREGGQWITGPSTQSDTASVHRWPDAPHVPSRRTHPWTTAFPPPPSPIGSAAASPARSFTASPSTGWTKNVFVQGEPITLKYWHGWTEQWAEMVQCVCDQFHAKQSRIRIEPEIVAWTEFETKFDSRHCRGDPPTSPPCSARPRSRPSPTRKRSSPSTTSRATTMPPFRPGWTPTSTSSVSTATRSTACPTGPGLSRSCGTRRTSPKRASIPRLAPPPSPSSMHWQTH